MSVEDKQFNAADGKHPALQKFNPNLQYAWEVFKSTAITALKGAVIVGLIAAVVVAPIALVSGGLAGIPLVGGLFTTLGFGLNNTLLAGALAGLQIGAVAGAAVGLAQGFGNAGDAVDEMEHSLINKYQRAQQLGASHKMLEAQLSRLGGQQPVGGMAAPQMQIPAMAQNMGKNQGFGGPG